MNISFNKAMEKTRKKFRKIDNQNWSMEEKVMVAIVSCGDNPFTDTILFGFVRIFCEEVKNIEMLEVASIIGNSFKKVDCGVFLGEKAFKLVYKKC